MALVYNAELRPSKIELVEGWAPSQPWFEGDAGVGLTNVASFRFDDPEGEVGIETLLVRAGDGSVLQVPLSYRGAPLEGADDQLIGTLEHSVLGQRWVYDGAGDPVYLLAVATAAAAGGSQAELIVDVDGEQVRREPTAHVTGTGTSGAHAPALPSVAEISIRAVGATTIAQTKSLHVVIARVLGAGDQSSQHQAQGDAAGVGGILSGTWSGQAEPCPLVWATVR